MSRGAMSSGGGRSSLGYLFEPEESALHHTTAKSNQETEKVTLTPDTNSSSVKDDSKMIGAEADLEPPQQLRPPKREVSNPILSSNRTPCNIYHTSQLSYNNSGFLITDRPSTRVRCAPGGPSSLGFLFGEEHEK
ncbi:unnamed protein product [Urochloa decumbens]|uniref:Uncharacterized protein n=1 Tax=Urochloa decumbens TaxID=240449 RepID=A0ABC9F4N1_9POAL